ncbi:type II toxin-antitoxin system RelE/ParE family toxin [Limosilactobacillus reuteri]|uniref:type II toxin-antitoxin system RelE family toxin n=1 Tax=Limosilactobacillus reuteri TaxID=1598 RepID=UPI001E49CB74|nr:type II toxin-antitoxin system RelE/ParE family toxin [Limosilactobacillus reuteri]MCC4370488.1 type II toxin-antitoxin system RelE/ParE family toxin [Limosilactobacillus reuteri]MCC4508236.1 type II toxin-antitoxin system RelE/ParE family toxin [Limosilactobacillus reuteri]
MSNNLYTWEFNEKAAKQFEKRLDKPVQRRIINWLDDHIEGSSNPRIWGKSLEGDLGTLWRYRVGSYRIIADIHDNIFTVEVVKAGKRNDIYKHR